MWFDAEKEMTCYVICIDLPLYYLCPLSLLDLTLMSLVYSVDFPDQHTAAVGLDPAVCSH